MKDTEEIEQVVLGAILLNPEGALYALENLKDEHFTLPGHVSVYKAIQQLFKYNSAIDIMTVCNQLKKMGVLESTGGAYFVSTLTNRVASSAHIESHTRIIQQNFLERKVRQIVSNLNYKLSEPKNDPFDLISNLENEITALMNGVIQSPTLKIGEIKDKVIQDCWDVLKSGSKSGVPCGIDRLNQQTNGWHNGDLIILAARTGMGKTSAALDFALHPAQQGIPVAVFSLEMSKESLAGRLLSMISFVNVQEIVNQTLDEDKLNYIEKEAKVLDNIPLFIDESHSMTLNDLRNKARRLKRTDGIKLIIIDYLQLMRGDNKVREQEISSITRGLKALAKELNVPIIALSQLSRKCEDRADKKPLLSDLRESGAIEQDADMVIFAHRPEYYGFSTYQLGNNEISAEGLFMFLISKFRNGRTGEVKARFIAENTLIVNHNS